MCPRRAHGAAVPRPRGREGLDLDEVLRLDAEFVRDAGRDPMFIVDNSTTGVIARNQSSNPGVSYTNFRYAVCDAVANSSAIDTNRWST